MSKSVKKITIDGEGNYEMTLTIDAYDTFDDLRLFVAEDLDINFVGSIWKYDVIEHSAISKIVVSFDENVHIYQLV